MIKMKKIKEILKQVEGDVLAIGLTPEEEEFLSKNKKITDMATLHNKNNLLFDRVKMKQKSKDKNISIRKLRKNFKKNRVYDTICNIDDVQSYFKYIIKDTVYFTKHKIYLYWNNDETIEELLQKRYHRYKVNIMKERKEEKTFFTIEVLDKKKNKWKDFFFFIGDTFYNGIELLRNFLTY